MHILLLSDSYPPEIRSASHLMYEFANMLSTRGHKVTVLTTMPRYNLLQVSFPYKYERVTYEDKIKVIRLDSLPLHKTAYVVRGIAQLILPYAFYYASRKFVYGKVDVIVVYSPPLTLGIVGVWLKQFFSSKAGSNFILSKVNW